MSDWQYFAPFGGWNTFQDSVGLTAALWERFPESDWHYLNLTTGSSAWESRQDGSTVRVQYNDKRIVGFEVGAGVSRDSIAALATKFQLVPVADHRPSLNCK